jgi:hypothetical protein
MFLFNILAHFINLLFQKAERKRIWTALWRNPFYFWTLPPQESLHSKLDNINNLLLITRGNSECMKSSHAWKILVTELSDNDMLYVIKQCTSDELYNIGYYSICLNRYQFLQRWWNKPSLPQIVGMTNWLDTLLALHLLRLSHVKCDRTKMLLTIFKSKCLRKMYPIILNWEKNNKITINDYRKLDSLPIEIQVRQLLVEMATAIPNGTHLLAGEWKRYEYDHCKVWNFVIPYRHFFNAKDIETSDLNVVYNNIYTTEHYTPLLQACRYGNEKDIAIFVRYPSFWVDFQYELPKYTDTLRYPITMLSINKNMQTFRYIMRLLYMTQKVCNQAGDCASLIWENCWIKKLFGIKECTSTISILSQTRLQNKYRRINMIRWLCPKECNIQLLHREYPKYVGDMHIDAIYYHYTTIRKPAHPYPEELLWLERQDPFISPKADGLYFEGSLPSDIFPVVYMRKHSQSERIELSDITLIIVFDQDYEGNWNSRMVQCGRQHKYWNGPYASISEENSDLEIFLAVARAENKSMVWWPKGVYRGFSGVDFFQLLSKPPLTVYPNDGWIIAGNKGPLIKVKPLTQLTLDVLYRKNCLGGGEWITGGDLSKGCCSSMSDNFDKYMITKFKNVPIPKNLPDSSLNLYYNRLLSDIKDDNINAKITLLQLLVFNLNHKNIEEYVTKVRSLFNTCEIPDNYKWFFQDPIIPPEIVYDGPAIYDGVWTCIWKNNKWRPLYRRYDKKCANSLAIAKLLTDTHQYPWNPIDLIPFMYKRPYYSDNIGSKHVELKMMFNKQLKDIQSFKRDENISIESANLGSGFQHTKGANYEIDPYIVAEQNWRNIATKQNWRRIELQRTIWVDVRTMKNPVTNQLFHISEKQISIQRSIHYFARDKEGWLSFLKSIENARTLYIAMIDAEQLFRKTDTYRFPDKSTMTRLKQSWHRGIWNCKSLLYWRSSEPIYEPVIAYSFLKQELQTLGWRETANKMSELGLRLLVWRKP